jgi:S-(hydroxymethyl)glutathione dehydrogenase/alcohol dehydrogenase
MMGVSIKAAILEQVNTPLTVEEVRLEGPRRGEVLVKLAASGVCHSDWHVVSGGTPHPLPVILGHEGAGMAVEVGEGVERVKVGDHVVLSWVPICGECFYCLHGLPAQCEGNADWAWKGTLRDGATRFWLGNQPVHHLSATSTFAEMTVVPEVSCVPVRRDVPLPAAALAGCAVATGLGAVVHTARVRPGQRVAVFGCGGVGLSIVQAAALAGALQIIAVDIAPGKLAMAAALGATHLVDSSQEDPVAAVKRLSDGRGADHVFEAIGNPAVMGQAYRAARIGGNILLVGIGPKGAQVSFSAADLPRSSKRICSSYYGDCDPRRDVPWILDLYAAGRLDLEKVISRTYRLEEINQAFEDMLAGRVARGVIVF